MKEDEPVRHLVSLFPVSSNEFLRIERKLPQKTIQSPVNKTARGSNNVFKNAKSEKKKEMFIDQRSTRHWASERNQRGNTFSFKKI